MPANNNDEILNENQGNTSAEEMSSPTTDGASQPAEILEGPVLTPTNSKKTARNIILNIISIISAIVFLVSGTYVVIDLVKTYDSNKKITNIDNEAGNTTDLTDSGILPTSILLSESAINFTDPEDSRDLVVRFIPDDTTNKAFTVQASDPDVVSVLVVNGIAKITPVKEGNTTLTFVSVADPKVTATCEIFVDYIDLSVPVESISLSEKTYTFTELEATYDFVATVTPDNATDKSFLVTLSEEGIVEASVTGNVITIKSLANGTVGVTVSAVDNPEISASFTVEVDYDPIPDAPVFYENILDDINFMNSPSLNKHYKENNQVVAWLYVPGPSSVEGLPISRSVLQTTDNNHYLNYDLYGDENISGWIFADFRCNMDELGYNTVLYGHARSYRMFGAVKKLNEFPEWYNVAENHFIRLNTLTEKTVWQIFSWYETNVNYNYIRTHFTSGSDFMIFAYEVQRRNTISAFQVQSFTEEDKILTLSTCKGTNKNNRVAMHAKLVKSIPYDSGIIKESD